MVKRIRRIEEMLDPTRPIAEPTTSIDGPTCGEWLFIVAKVQAGLPLSIAERDFVADVLREKWLKPKEYAAYRRTVKLKHIEVARKLVATSWLDAPDAWSKPADNAKKKQSVRRGDRERWVQETHGFPSQRALEEFVKRERKHRR
jgi:hypothetical protein